MSPTAALRPCANPGCGFLVPRGYCRLHARERERQRPNLEARRWYHTARFKALRQQVLQRDPLCVECLKVDKIEATTDVDHIVPHRGDESLFFDYDNLQGLCHACHSAKTRAGG